MDTAGLPLTGTCQLTTVGRRSGQERRVEIWYVIVDEQFVVTGTPGARDWLANLREHPNAVLHLGSPHGDLAVTAYEVTDEARRQRVVSEAWRLQPWYAAHPHTREDWVAVAPMVTLGPTRT